MNPAKFFEGIATSLTAATATSTASATYAGDLSAIVNNFKPVKGECGIANGVNSKLFSGGLTTVTAERTQRLRERLHRREEPEYRIGSPDIPRVHHAHRQPQHGHSIADNPVEREGQGTGMDRDILRPSGRHTGVNPNITSDQGEYS